MTAFLKFLKALWDYIWDTLRRMLLWFRKPGSPLKFVCGVLAFGSIWIGLIAYDREQEVVRLSELRAKESADFMAQISDLNFALSDRDSKLQQIADIMDREKDKLKLMEENNARLLGRLLEEQTRHQIENQEWMDRFNNQPVTCKAAREMLDVACASLGGY